MQKKIHVILPRAESNKKAKHKILKVVVYCRVSKNTRLLLHLYFNADSCTIKYISFRLYGVYYSNWRHGHDL